MKKRSQVKYLFQFEAQDNNNFRWIVKKIPSKMAS